MRKISFLLVLLPTIAFAGRDGSGTYSLPNVDVSAGQTITSSWANTTLHDIATELTNSLDRSGRGSMSAPFKLTNGTCAAPSGTFLSEISSGLYWNGANDVRVCIGGSPVLKFGVSGLSLLGSATLNSGAIANSSLTLTGNRAAADTGADVVTNSAVTRTAGSLLDIQNLGVSQVHFDFAGKLAASPANSSLTLVGNRSAADAGSDVVVNSTATRTAGLLLDVQNVGTSKLAVGYDGTTILRGAAKLSTDNANGTLTLKGNRTDANPDVMIDTAPVNRNGPNLIFDVRNNGSSVFYVNGNGLAHLSGQLVAYGGLDTQGQPITTNGGALATVGGVITSGNITATGNITASGTVAGAAVTGLGAARATGSFVFGGSGSHTINIGSWGIVGGAGSVTFSSAAPDANYILLITVAGSNAAAPQPVCDVAKTTGGFTFHVCGVGTDGLGNYYLTSVAPSTGASFSFMASW